MGAGGAVDGKLYGGSNDGAVPSFAAACMGAPPEPTAAGVAAPALAPTDLDAGTPDAWVPRDPRVIRLTGRHPLNCEPSLDDLMASGFITQTSLHFVRNHGAVPRREWASHRVAVTGMVDNPLDLSMEELLALPARSVTVTMACAGNRRKEQNMHKQSQGFNWGAGAASTAVWTGVRLCDVLALAKAKSAADGARFVHFRGPANELPKGDGTYGTSITLAKASDPAQDVLLAYKQNNRWLTPDHGFPVRVILPGHIGGRTVKWLTEIKVADCESDNWYHYHDNRVLPPDADAAAAERMGLWYNPDYMINHLNINSAICEPAHDAVVPLAADGTVTLRGYAYSGGGRKVTRVEVSLDGGEAWRQAAIERFEPPTQYGMHWAWVFWRLDVCVAALAASPTRDIQLRAADESMNVQPSNLTWSLLGMMGNQHFRVKIHIHTGPDGSLGLRFQHPAPIHPGPLGNVGWREEEAAARTPVTDDAPVAVSRVATDRRVTKRELAAHTGEDSAWFAYHGRVYDGTAFLDAHPGGADSILIAAGGDATADFDAIHSAKAKAMLDAYLVGDLVSDDEGEGRVGEDGDPVADAGPPVALNPRERRAFPLVHKQILSRDTRLLRFGLPSPDHALGLPVGKHVFLYGTPGGGEVMRAYTPVSCDADKGVMELVIKVYDDSLGGGKMSRWLDSLALGDPVHAKGPVGHFVYDGRGRCLVNRKPVAVTHMTFVAAGTGITPCFAVIRAAVDDPDDEVAMTLVYGNRHDDDVLLMDRLEELKERAGGRLSIVYTLSRPSPGWPHREGRVDEAMLRDVAHPPGPGSLALMCGPHALVDDVCKPAFQAIGFKPENIITF